MEDTPLKQFTHLVIQWFQEEKLYFVETPDNELLLIIEFPAGGETVGDNNASFPWMEIYKLAKQQNLLKEQRRVG